MRLFVGIPIEGVLNQSVSALIAELKRRFPECRWVQPQNLHFTLRFLGEVPTADLPRVIDWFDACAQQSRLGVLELDTPGCFKSPDQFVFWLGLREAEWLQAAARQFARPLGSIPVADHEFVPHLTIGRYRVTPPREPQFKEFFRYYESLEVPRISQANARLVLFESKLTENGAVYAERRSCPNPCSSMG